jgi:D-amino-acid dehydrogenase
VATIAVVGGGIIGSAAAAWLTADGHRVTMFERALDARPASSGGAGIIALSEISPVARPSVLRSVPKWLVDPLGPLSIRAEALPGLVPFLFRFAAASRQAKVEASTAALAAIMTTVIADHQELARRAGLAGHIRRTGALYIFGTEAGYRAGLPEWDERGRHGIRFEEIHPEDAQDMVPALEGTVARAIFAPDNWMATSPHAILTALRRRIREIADLSTREIVGIRPDERDIGVITAEGGDIPFDRVVIAGGVWSRDLVRALGLSVVLQAERGYNTTFARSGIDLPMPIFFSEHGFVASPVAEGVRVGGAVELASPDAPPNFKRAAAMRKKARRFIPDLPEEGGLEWMGSRPSTPDSLPVIGADPRDPRIIYAFGHGHLGVTLSATTACRRRPRGSSPASPPVGPTPC